VFEIESYASLRLKNDVLPNYVGSHLSHNSVCLLSQSSSSRVSDGIRIKRAIRANQNAEKKAEQEGDAERRPAMIDARPVITE
jgi:hypothetical protein